MSYLGREENLPEPFGTREDTVSRLHGGTREWKPRWAAWTKYEFYIGSTEDESPVPLRCLRRFADREAPTLSRVRVRTRESVGMRRQAPARPHRGRRRRSGAAPEEAAQAVTGARVGRGVVAAALATNALGLGAGPTVKASVEAAVRPTISSRGEEYAPRGRLSSMIEVGNAPQRSFSPLSLCCRENPSLRNTPEFIKVWVRNHSQKNSKPS